MTAGEKSPSGNKLSHVNQSGEANMVDVGDKDVTKRFARAVAIINIGETAYNLVANNQVRNI